MDFIARGTSTPALHNLPLDAVVEIACRLPPPDVLALTSAHPDFRQLLSQTYLWRALSDKHLSASAGCESKDSFVASAKTIQGRWRVACGTIVRGVPVHLRSGPFVTVRARGGAERAIMSARREAAYVMRIQPQTDSAQYDRGDLFMSWRNRSSSLSSSNSTMAASPHILTSSTGSPSAIAPSVEIDFKLGGQNAGEPYPVGGVLIRIIHAVQVEIGLSSDTALNAVALEITINGVPIACESRLASEAAGRFVAYDVVVPPKLLNAPGRLNTVTVKLGGYGGVSYWLKELSMYPAVLGFPDFDRVVDGGTLPMAVPSISDTSNSPRRTCKYYSPPSSPISPLQHSVHR